MADPGFPVGWRRAVGGHQPPTWVFFGKNICENERIGSRWGAPLDPPMIDKDDEHHYQYRTAFDG